MGCKVCVLHPCAVAAALFWLTAKHNEINTILQQESIFIVIPDIIFNVNSSCSAQVAVVPVGIGCEIWSTVWHGKFRESKT